MGKLCKRLVSIITTAVIAVGLTLTSIPAYEATAATTNKIFFIVIFVLIVKHLLPTKVFIIPRFMSEFLLL